MSTAPINSSPTHVNRIMAVMEAAFDPAFGEAWNRRQITDALVLTSTHALILDPDGHPIPDTAPADDPRQPAGFILTRQAADEEELLLIAVLPEFRRKGLGEALIRHMFTRAEARRTRHIFLEMRRGNPAIRLYEKMGFEPIGERQEYYRLANGSRVDAITFRCSI
ncbi:MAG: GNAT family N-acetyltransferase [Pseudomonadota bacterium]